MIQKLTQYGVAGILLMLLQVAVVNNMVLFRMVHPHIYVMILAILPFAMPQWSILLISFGVGIVMDLFTYTPGMHASACVMAGFMRPHLLNLFNPIQGVNEAEAPHVHALGFGNFLLYLLAFVLFHHLVLHLVEVFSFEEFDRTLLRIGVNTIASWLLMVVIELLGFYRNSNR